MSNNGQYANSWAVILGASSGFGLASAQALASQGMNLCLVHRDRKGSMSRIDEAFEALRAKGVSVVSFNTNALDDGEREKILTDLKEMFHKGGERQSVKILLHSIAFGSLKLLAPSKPRSPKAITALAERLSLSPEKCQSAVDELFQSGIAPELERIASAPEYNQEMFLSDSEMMETINAMGLSLLSWTRSIFQHGLFGSDGRVVGLTSEGNEVAWYGYAAVSAAKLVLESISRSIAKEYGSHGIRSNIVQPGVTDTRALRLIPGSANLVAHSLLRNPLGRLTQVEDVANVVAFLASEQAQWINGSLIRVDGGEHISG